MRKHKSSGPREGKALPAMVENLGVQTGEPSGGALRLLARGDRPDRAWQRPRWPDVPSGALSHHLELAFSALGPRHEEGPSKPVSRARKRAARSRENEHCPRCGRSFWNQPLGTELSSPVPALITYKYEGPLVPLPGDDGGSISGTEPLFDVTSGMRALGSILLTTCLEGRFCTTWNLDLNETSPCKVHLRDN